MTPHAPRAARGPFFGSDRYAAVALGSAREIGSSFADLDLHVATRGLSESVVPGFDDDVLEVLSADAAAAEVVRRTLFDQSASAELWSQPNFVMELHQYLAQLVERGVVYLHLDFRRAARTEPILLTSVTWLAPETLLRRERGRRVVYEQFMSQRRFDDERIVVTDEPQDLLAELPAEDVVRIRWPFGDAASTRPPAAEALHVGRLVDRSAARSLFAARAGAEPHETFLPIARARVGAFANALDDQKVLSARIKDCLFYPGAYEAEIFPWVDDVTDFFRAERMIRSRIGIARLRAYLFDQLNRQLLGRWCDLNGWPEVRLKLRADAFTVADWLNLYDELGAGGVSVDDVRAAIAAEHESAREHGG